jgi:hypothetical protein
MRRGAAIVRIPRRQRELKLSEWDDLGDELAGPGKPDGPEELFASQCRAYRLPAFERQLQFAKAAMGRRWLLDFGFRDYLLGVEIQGVVVRRIGGVLVTSGAHADVQGLRKEHEKHNAAVLLGWSILEFMPAEIKPLRAIEMTMRVLAARGWRQQE